jgi:hypothetical protein
VKTWTLLCNMIRRASYHLAIIPAWLYCSTNQAVLYRGALSLPHGLEQQWWLTLVCARELHANTVSQSQSIWEPQADPSHQWQLNQPEATCVWLRLTAVLASLALLRRAHPVPKADRKGCVKFRTTPSLRTGLILLNCIASEHPLGPVTMHLKPKTSKALIWAKGFWYSFWERKCALCQNWWEQHRYTAIQARLHGNLFR